jgi:uncharacterized protein YjbJ (UPF0337 family)
MNKDQATGAAKQLGGKMQEEIGKLVGSKVQQAKGIKKQIVGNVQESVGDVKAAVKQVKNGK